MDKAFLRVRTRLTLLTVAVATFCALLSVVGTYVIAEQRMTESINASRLGQLAEVNPELSSYLDSQDKYSAHFDSIAEIIQREDRKQLMSTLPIVFGVVFIVSSVLGWLLARKLLEPIQEAYAIQRRFMQDATHELRNPLAAMKSILQQLQQKKLSKPLSLSLNSLERQADHLTNITTDLLLLERSEIASREVIDIVPLLQDVIEELHHKTRQKNITLKIDHPDTLLAVISASHFIAIAKNILDNAIKFSPEDKGRVVVVLKSRSSGWHLQVNDNGIGIKKGELKYLTQRFYRASNTGTIEGTGLGLAIVAKYVNLYNGTLTIKSGTRGTVVIVRM